MLLSILLGCSACISCAPPFRWITTTMIKRTIKIQTPEKKDSGDTAVDTAPPPPCPFMEEEPNGDYDTAQIVQMEKWILWNV